MRDSFIYKIFRKHPRTFKSKGYCHTNYFPADEYEAAIPKENKYQYISVPDGWWAGTEALQPGVIRSTYIFRDDEPISNLGVNPYRHTEHYYCLLPYQYMRDVFSDDSLIINIDSKLDRYRHLQQSILMENKYFDSEDDYISLFRNIRKYSKDLGVDYEIVSRSKIWPRFINGSLEQRSLQPMFPKYVLRHKREDVFDLGRLIDYFNSQASVDILKLNKDSMMFSSQHYSYRALEGNIDDYFWVFLRMISLPLPAISFSTNLKTSQDRLDKHTYGSGKYEPWRGISAKINISEMKALWNLDREPQGRDNDLSKINSSHLFFKDWEQDPAHQIFKSIAFNTVYMISNLVVPYSGDFIATLTKSIMAPEAPGREQSIEVSYSGIRGALLEIDGNMWDEGATGSGTIESHSIKKPLDIGMLRFAAEQSQLAGYWSLHDPVASHHIKNRSYMDINLRELARFTSSAVGQEAITLKHMSYSSSGGNGMWFNDEASHDWSIYKDWSHGYFIKEAPTMLIKRGGKHEGNNLYSFNENLFGLFEAPEAPRENTPYNATITSRYFRESRERFGMYADRVATAMPLSRYAMRNHTVSFASTRTKARSRKSKILSWDNSISYLINSFIGSGSVYHKPVTIKQVRKDPKNIYYRVSYEDKILNHLWKEPGAIQYKLPMRDPMSFDIANGLPSEIYPEINLLPVNHLVLHPSSIGSEKIDNLSYFRERVLPERLTRSHYRANAKMEPIGRPGITYLIEFDSVKKSNSLLNNYSINHDEIENKFSVNILGTSVKNLSTNKEMLLSTRNDKIHEVQYLASFKVAIGDNSYMKFGLGAKSSVYHHKEPSSPITVGWATRSSAFLTGMSTEFRQMESIVYIFRLIYKHLKRDVDSIDMSNPWNSQSSLVDYLQHLFTHFFAKRQGFDLRLVEFDDRIKISRGLTRLEKDLKALDSKFNHIYKSNLEDYFKTSKYHLQEIGEDKDVDTIREWAKLKVEKRMDSEYDEILRKILPDELKVLHENYGSIWYDRKASFLQLLAPLTQVSLSLGIDSKNTITKAMSEKTWLGKMLYIYVSSLEDEDGRIELVCITASMFKLFELPNGENQKWNWLLQSVHGTVPVDIRKDCLFSGTIRFFWSKKASIDNYELKHTRLEETSPWYHAKKWLEATVDDLQYALHWLSIRPSPKHSARDKIMQVLRQKQRSELIA